MAPKRTPASPTGSSGFSDGKGEDEEGGHAHDSTKLRALPKLPMVRHGKQWFRCKNIKITAAKVQLEYCGFEDNNTPFWLPLTSPRLWRGSYKGKDWRHLGDGAWEPKKREGGPKQSHKKTASQKRQSEADQGQSAEDNSDSESESESELESQSDDGSIPDVSPTRKGGSSGCKSDPKPPVRRNAKAQPSSGKGWPPTRGATSPTAPISRSQAAAAASVRAPPAAGGKLAAAAGKLSPALAVKVPAAVAARTAPPKAVAKMKVEEAPQAKPAVSKRGSKNSTDGSKVVAAADKPAGPSVRSRGAPAAASPTVRSPEAASKAPPTAAALGGRRTGGGRKPVPPPAEMKESSSPRGARGSDRGENSAVKAARPAGNGRSSKGAVAAATAAVKGGKRDGAQESKLDAASAGGGSPTGDELEGGNGGGSPLTMGNRKRKASTSDVKPALAKRQRGGPAKGAVNQKPAESTAATAANDAGSEDTAAMSGNSGSGTASPASGKGSRRGSKGGATAAPTVVSVPTIVPASQEASPPRPSAKKVKQRGRKGKITPISPPMTEAAMSDAEEPAANHEDLGKPQPDTAKAPSSTPLTESETPEDATPANPVPTSAEEVNHSENDAGTDSSSLCSSKHQPSLPPPLDSALPNGVTAHLPGQPGAAAAAGSVKEAGVARSSLSKGSSRKGGATHEVLAGPAVDSEAASPEPAGPASDPTTSVDPSESAPIDPPVDAALLPPPRANSHASGGSTPGGSRVQAPPPLAMSTPEDDAAAAAAASAMEGMQRAPSVGLPSQADIQSPNSTVPAVPHVVRATGASRRKRGNPLPATAPRDTLPAAPQSGDGGTWENDSLADDAELLLCARESRPSPVPTQSNGHGARKRARAAATAAAEVEKPLLSKEDRWKAIARMLDQDDLEADSDDFQVVDNEPFVHKPVVVALPPRKGRWGGRNAGGRGTSAAEESPPPERTKRERAVPGHRYGEEVVEEEPAPIKRGRWAGHVKKIRASANGTSNLRPRVAAAPAAAANHPAALAAASAKVVQISHSDNPSNGAISAPTNSASRSFSALFEALSAVERGVPFRRVEVRGAQAAQAQGSGDQEPFQLFGSKWLQPPPHMPRIISVRPDLFGNPMSKAFEALPVPVVPLFR